LIRRTKAAEELLADKAYDSDDLRGWLGERGTKAVIPNKSNRALMCVESIIWTSVDRPRSANLWNKVSQTPRRAHRGCRSLSMDHTLVGNRTSGSRS
jgi:transposase